MADIVEDCLRGTLNADRLQAYHEIGNVDVDAPGAKNVTPLAAACWKGHLNVVRVLLDNPHVLASPDAPSFRGRTPLHFATTQSPRKNRAAIVKRLLDAGANVDASSKEDGLNTPLMNAITQIKDEEVVRILVDAGASLDVKNAQGKSAQDLAKTQGGRFTNALQGSKGLTSSIAAAIDVILAVVMFVIAWTNNAALADYMVQVANGINDRLGPMQKGDQDASVQPIDNGGKTDTVKNDTGAAPVTPAPKAGDAPQVVNGAKSVNQPSPVTTSQPAASLQRAPVPQQAVTADQSFLPQQTPTPVPPKPTAPSQPPTPRPAPLASQPSVSAQQAVFPPRSATPQRASTPQPAPSTTQRPPYQGIGNVQDRYGLSGTGNPVAKPIEDNVKANIGGVQTVEELKKGVSQYLEDAGLDEFFAPNDPFISGLIDKANNLRNKPNETLNTKDSIERLTRLALYQPVVYCDDSGSMSTDNRSVMQAEIVARIARVATRLVPDGYGVELRFINSSFSKNCGRDEIEAAVRSVRPTGGTALGTSLRARILKPLVYDLLDRKKTLTRPLLICTITDGNPTSENESTFKNAIVECKRKLLEAGYESTAVRFLISQIGNDSQAYAFLKELGQDQEIADVVYCTSNRLDDDLKQFKGNEKRLDEWLLKTLTNPIMSND